jgi:hypothetical protein
LTIEIIKILWVSISISRWSRLYLTPATKWREQSRHFNLLPVPIAGLTHHVVF